LERLLPAALLLLPPFGLFPELLHADSARTPTTRSAGAVDRNHECLRRRPFRPGGDHWAT